MLFGCLGRLFLFLGHLGLLFFFLRFDDGLLTFHCWRLEDEWVRRLSAISIQAHNFAVDKSIKAALIIILRLLLLLNAFGLFGKEVMHSVNVLIDIGVSLSLVHRTQHLDGLVKHDHLLLPLGVLLHVHLSGLLSRGLLCGLRGMSHLSDRNLGGTHSVGLGRLTLC